MKTVNIVFDDFFDDADIIAVPDEILSQIEEIGQKFLRWVPTTEDPDYWGLVGGRKCSLLKQTGSLSG